MISHNRYATIQASVLLCKEISHGEKLLIALISNLSNLKDYCWASNRYLAECLNLKERQVQRYLSHLEELGIVGRVTKINENTDIEFRALTVNFDADVLKKITLPEPDGVSEKTYPPVADDIPPLSRMTPIYNQYKNQEEENTPLPPKRGIPTSSFSQTPILLELPYKGERFAELWEQIKSMPKWKKKPVNALNLAIKKLARWDEDIACEMLERAIVGGWQGLFELKQHEIDALRKKIAEDERKAKSNLGPNNRPKGWEPSWDQY